MAEFYRFINGRPVKRGSPEDLEDLKNNPEEEKVIVSRSLTREAKRMEDREKFVGDLEHNVSGSIERFETEIARLQEKLHDYASYENYRALEIQRVRDAQGAMTWEGGASGPNGNDWRIALESVRSGIASRIDGAETYKLVQRAFAEDGRTKGVERIEAAMLALARNHEALVQEHEARRRTLWQTHERLQQEPNNAALKEIYGTKYAEYQEEEIELARFAKARTFLTEKRTELKNLFEA